MRQLSPPTLPPHLLQVLGTISILTCIIITIGIIVDHGHHLQVMLNRDVSYQPDPTLLEEPSHVMLNHFYAQVNHHDHADVESTLLI